MKAIAAAQGPVPARVVGTVCCGVVVGTGEGVVGAEVALVRFTDGTGRRVEI
jgi:hypothetical protein